MFRERLSQQVSTTFRIHRRVNARAARAVSDAMTMPIFRRAATWREYPRYFRTRQRRLGKSARGAIKRAIFSPDDALHFAPSRHRLTRDGDKDKRRFRFCGREKFLAKNRLVRPVARLIGRVVASFTAINKDNFVRYSPLYDDTLVSNVITPREIASIIQPAK